MHKTPLFKPLKSPKPRHLRITASVLALSMMLSSAAFAEESVSSAADNSAVAVLDAADSFSDREKIKSDENLNSGENVNSEKNFDSREEPNPETSDNSSEPLNSEENLYPEETLNTEKVIVPDQYADSENTVKPYQNPDSEEELIIEEEFSSTTDSSASYTSEELLSGYINSQFYRRIPLLRARLISGESLTGQTRILYDQLEGQIKQAASGTVSSTQFILPGTEIMGKERYTAEELGVEAVTADNARALAKTLMNYDSGKLLNALLRDMPYELFWFDKASGGMKISYSIAMKSSYLRITQFKVSFTVSQDYRGDNVFTADSEKIRSIQTAVDNAEAILDQAAELSDYEKIKYYRDRICDLASYNIAVSDGTSPIIYGNPWQMIYVFDGDPETEVVCEGYAKAFQYLMDQTSFTSQDVYSITATGTLSGVNHMWNIVHMEDGNNYLADLTAVDQHPYQNRTIRFLQAPHAGNPSQGYTYRAQTAKDPEGEKVTVAGSLYSYDSDTLALFEEAALTLASADYPATENDKNQDSPEPPSGEDPSDPSQDDPKDSKKDPSSTEPSLNFTNPDQTEQEITVSANGIQTAQPGGYYTAAVWSAQNGQDDIRWYTLDSSFRCRVPAAKHRSSGSYYVHLYYRTPSGEMQFVTAGAFMIHPVQAERIEVTDVNQDRGTAQITLYGVSSPSGVEKVQFPVWCANDQSDIHWYQGQQIENGVYRITLDTAKHRFHSGIYKIHTYGTNGISSMDFILGTTCSITVKGPVLSASLKDSGYTLRADNLDTASAKEIYFAVWSTRNGQDDLKWLRVRPLAGGSVSLDWYPEEFGAYAVHCYMKTNAGQMVFQRGISVDVPKPAADSMEIRRDSGAGRFRITVKGLKSSKKIKKLLIPVWSDSKQKDIVWYTAARQSDGSYIVNSAISSHGNRRGIYHAHAYVQTQSGEMLFVKGTDFKM